MFVYALALRPVVAAGGLEALDESKKMMFQGILHFMSKMIQASDEVDSVDVLEDSSLLIKANKDVYDILKKKLGENAIITRIESEVL